MTEKSTKNCQKCGKTRDRETQNVSAPGVLTLTQWIFTGDGPCTCTEEDETQAQAARSRLCPVCHKEIEEEARKTGTVTQWVLRSGSDTCRCIQDKESKSETLQPIESDPDLPNRNHDLQLESGADPDRYIAVEFLGKGGQARVYKCFDLYLRKYVALKVLSSAYKSQGTNRKVIRFQKEAKALCRLNHSNISRILDLGVTINQEPFMVIDLVEGVLLQDIAPLSHADTLKLAEDLTEALEHSHSLDILHGDISPGNVICMFSGARLEKATLIDFGLNKMLDVESPNDKETESNSLAGTLHFMSPDQTIDKRSDLYSLVAVLYFALRAKAPANLDEITEDPINTFIKTGLARDPKARFQSPGEVLEALQAALSDPEKEESEIVAGVLDRRPFPAAVLILITSITVMLPLFFLLPQSKTPVKEKRLEKNTEAITNDFQSPRPSLKLSGSRASIMNAKDKDLEEVLDNPRIDTLTVKLSTIDGSAFKKAKNSSLKHLTFLDCRLSDAVPQQLPVLSKLKILNFTRCDDITGDAFAALLSSNSLCQLELLSVPVSRISSEAISKMPLLKEVTLFSCPGVDSKAIASFNNTKSLERFNLGGPQIGVAEIETLTELKTTTRYGFHNIKQKTAVDAIAKLIASRSNRITFIDLNDIAVTTSLVEALRFCKKLDVLYLMEMAELQPQQLATITKDNQIGCLVLSGNNIDHGSVQALLTSKGLKILDITRCPSLSMADIARLKKRLPDTKIVAAESVF